MYRAYIVTVHLQHIVLDIGMLLFDMNSIQHSKKIKVKFNQFVHAMYLLEAL